MTRFITILFAILAFGHLSEAKHLKKKLPSVVIVGKVYCDTCFQQDFGKTSHFISGASVAVECEYGKTPKPIFREEAKTDERGEFKVRLPFSVSKHVKRLEGCSVKLIRSSEPYCAAASTATSSSIRLESRRHGTHVFSAGFFTFKPLNQPTLCNQKPVITETLKTALNPKPKKPFIKPHVHKTDHQRVDPKETFFLPPNPFLPPPPLIPNPFQPPPPLFPNPFQPTPPPLFPNPFQPPPAAPTPFFPFPGLTPSPPPPPPAFPFPFPPFPFRPPRSPGTPPAS